LLGVIFFNEVCQGFINFDHAFVFFQILVLSL
jgi:hypothetical protein